MKKNLALVCGAVLTAWMASSSHAATLFMEDFDVDNSTNWTTNDPGVTDILVDYFYDYSRIGVPPAPGGASTIGLKMTANNTNGVFGGFSVSPTGQSFSGRYQVKFNLWQNYVGPVGLGGSGTTQISTFGIGTAGNVGVFPGGATSESVMFGVTLDGGSSSDYRAYSSAAPTRYVDGDPVYFSPSTNGNATYYTTPFPGGQAAPGDQVTLYPGQTGTTDPGEIGFAWREVTIDVDNGFALWSVDGVPLANVDLSTVTLGGGNILLGHGDTNASSSADPNDTLLNVTLIDNVMVCRIPEPASFALLGVSLLGLVAMARKRT